MGPLVENQGFLVHWGLADATECHEVTVVDKQLGSSLLMGICTLIPLTYPWFLSTQSPMVGHSFSGQWCMEF